MVRLAVNPDVLDECCRGIEEKSLLLQLCLQYLEKSHSLGISRRYEILEDTQYKGDPAVLLKNFYLKRDDAERKKVDDFMSDITNMSPDSLLSQLGKISTDDDGDSASDTILSSEHPHITMPTSGPSSGKTRLIEELSSEDVELEIPDHEICLKDADGKRPRRLVVKVTMPQVTSVNGCELDITEVRV